MPPKGAKTPVVNRRVSGRRSGNVTEFLSLDLYATGKIEERVKTFKQNQNHNGVKVDHPVPKSPAASTNVSSSSTAKRPRAKSVVAQSKQGNKRAKRAASVSASSEATTRASSSSRDASAEPTPRKRGGRVSSVAPAARGARAKSARPKSPAPAKARTGAKSPAPKATAASRQKSTPATKKTASARKSRAPTAPPAASRAAAKTVTVKLEPPASDDEEVAERQLAGFAAPSSSASTRRPSRSSRARTPAAAAAAAVTTSSSSTTSVVQQQQQVPAADAAAAAEAALEDVKKEDNLRNAIVSYMAEVSPEASHKRKAMVSMMTMLCMSAATATAGRRHTYHGDAINHLHEAKLAIDRAAQYEDPAHIKAQLEQLEREKAALADGLEAAEAREADAAAAAAAESAQLQQQVAQLQREKKQLQTQLDAQEVQVVGENRAPNTAFSRGVSGHNARPHADLASSLHNQLALHQAAAAYNNMPTLPRGATIGHTSMMGRAGELVNGLANIPGLEDSLAHVAVSAATMEEYDEYGNPIQRTVRTRVERIAVHDGMDVDELRARGFEIVPDGSSDEEEEVENDINDVPARIEEVAASEDDDVVEMGEAAPAPYVDEAE